jgi:hypothetical protein
MNQELTPKNKPTTLKEQYIVAWKAYQEAKRLELEAWAVFNKVAQALGGEENTTSCCL